MEWMQLEAMVASNPTPSAREVRYWVDEREVRLVAHHAHWWLIAPLAVEGPLAPLLPQLLHDAMGRLLCDESGLAWDDAEAGLVLWQRLPQGCSPSQFRDGLEAFLNERAWWFDRMDALATVHHQVSVPRDQW